MLVTQAKKSEQDTITSAGRGCTTAASLKLLATRTGEDGNINLKPGMSSGLKLSFNFESCKHYNLLDRPKIENADSFVV